MMGVIEFEEPHSSGKVLLSGRDPSNQQDVIIEPSTLDSIRNLLRRVVRGKDSGGTRSHGRRMKSF